MKIMLFFGLICCGQSLLYSAEISRDSDKVRFCTEQEVILIEKEDISQLVSLSPILAGKLLKSVHQASFNDDLSLKISPTQLDVLLQLSKRAGDPYNAVMQAAHRLSNQSIDQKGALLAGLLHVIELCEMLHIDYCHSAAYRLYNLFLKRKSIKKYLAQIEQSEKETIFDCDPLHKSSIMQHIAYGNIASLLKNESRSYEAEKFIPFSSSHAALNIVRYNTNGSTLLCADRQNVSIFNEHDSTFTWHVPVSSDPFNPHGFISDVAYCADAALAITHNGRLIRIMLETGNSEQELWFPQDYRQEQFAQYFFSGDGTQLIRNSVSEQIISKYACDRQTRTHTINVDTNIISSATMSHDNAIITFGSQKGLLFLADARHPEKMKSYKIGKKPITKLAWSLGDKHCAILSRDKKLRLWDIRNGRKHTYSLPVVMNHVWWVSEHMMLLASPGGIYIQNLDEKNPTCFIQTNALETRNQKITSLAVNPTNGRLALGYDRGALHKTDGPFNVVQSMLSRYESIEALLPLIQQKKAGVFSRDVKKIFKH